MSSTSATNNIVPMVYTAEDIMIMLKISKSTAYNLLHDAPFAVIRLGDTYRVPKETFDTWVMQK